ncbi:MAG: LuxR family transcriptional regulator [Acetobacteraceae bacterium]|nr:MAG: LuxR family transcriptional regulator [Acetobacteraceae bacterium]
MPRGRPPHPDMLTPAEWCVVELVRHGQSTAAIARLLGISPDAVKAQARAARDKLGLTSRHETGPASAPGRSDIRRKGSPCPDFRRYLVGSRSLTAPEPSGATPCICPSSTPSQASPSSILAALA